MADSIRNADPVRNDRLGAVESLIALIGDTLSDHTEKLDLLIGRSGPNPPGADSAEISPSETDPNHPEPERFNLSLDEGPRVADPLEAKEVIAAARPHDLEYDRTVVVRFYIDEEGKAQDPRVLRESGDAQLDTAAMNAARNITFNPARAGGEPIGVWVTWPITFTSGSTQEDQPLPFWDTYRDMTSELNAVVRAIDEAGMWRVANNPSGSDSTLIEARRLSRAPALSRCDNQGGWMPQTVPGWNQQMRRVAELICANRRSLGEQIGVAEKLLSRRLEGDSEPAARSDELVATWDSAQAAYDSGREDLLLLIPELRDGGTQ